MDYQIAIPTYGRPEGVKKLTLNYLEKTDINCSHVTLFVANDEEKEVYQSSNPTYNIVVGEKGLTRQRHFISNFYDKGTPIFSFDDDVSAVEELELLENLEGTQKPLDHPCRLKTVVELSELIDRGFRMCKRRDIGLFGFYAVRNKGFLHPKVTVGLKFIMGHAFGFYAGDPAFELITEYSMKDDYFLSLYHTVNGNGTLRFDNICVKAKQHTGGGGTCEDLERKLQINNQTVEKLCAEFPDLASPKSRRTKDEWLSRYSEIRLKTITNETISVFN
jgi:hypothetical protein